MSAPTCPVCAKKYALGPVTPPTTPPLLQCPSCRGLWATAEVVGTLRSRYGRRHSILTAQCEGHACRRCRKKLGRSTAKCRVCGALQALACVTCNKPMESLRVETVVVDVCRPCRAAWFDAGELPVVAHFGASLVVARDERASHFTPGDFLFDPGPELVARGVELIPDAVASTGEGAVAAVEIVGELAVNAVSGVAEVTVQAIGALVAGVFDGL